MPIRTAKIRGRLKKQTIKENLFFIILALWLQAVYRIWYGKSVSHRNPFQDICSRSIGVLQSYLPTFQLFGWLVRTLTIEGDIRFHPLRCSNVIILSNIDRVRRWVQSYCSFFTKTPTF